LTSFFGEGAVASDELKAKIKEDAEAQLTQADQNY
jgi:hypothetical protein